MHGTRSKPKKKKTKRPLHNGSLKEVERQKNEAKKELRRARRSGSPADAVHSLAKHFFSLVRCHSHLKRASVAWLMTRDARAARVRCQKNFRGCVREVLDGSAQQIVPAFSDTTASQYFSESSDLCPT